MEGLARALRVFLQKDQPPTYTLSNSAKIQEVYVESSVSCFPLARRAAELRSTGIAIEAILRICGPPTRSTTERLGIRKLH